MLQSVKDGHPHFRSSISPFSGWPGKVPLVVFSHLRWEFVTQRPQHIISRLARHRPVYFIEEPIDFSPNEEGTARIYSAENNILVIQPKISNTNFKSFYKHLSEKYDWDTGPAPVLWFYSAAFLDALSEIPHSAVVYDCMDELSAFKGAREELRRQEQQLLAVANVVFTGGKSLYKKKKPHNANTHCFPSSVDEAHFAKARQAVCPVPADIAEIPRPTVGYFGVIDERIDLELLEKISQQNPTVSFVMIGPVVKIDPATLPQNSNLHYLGGKPYADLPGYLKAFDVAMMPFALNEATEFISPTKTLEYIAGHKPVVSTPIADVVRDYTGDVALAASAKEFSRELQSILAETPQDSQKRKARYREILARGSWDNTAENMAQLIAECYEKRNGTPDENNVAELANAPI